jgi:signal transduction histidine kinase
MQTSSPGTRAISAGRPATAEVAGRSFPVFGTYGSVLVTSPGALAAACTRLAAETAAIDAACSRFRADSEISLVNRAGGRVVEVSHLFAKALRTALTAAALTDGDVDPTCGGSLVNLGYDRDFAQVRADTTALTRAAEPAPGWQQVELDIRRRTVRIPASALLPLGWRPRRLIETVADLSHRLRTPLTALRIDAETLRDHEEMTRVIAGVDGLSHTVNEIIREARRPTAADSGATCDVVDIVAGRTAFWRPLAEDQDRRMTVDLPDAQLPVLVPARDMTACLDILLENVFAHTPEGTSFSVRVSARAGCGAWLVVSDDGPGFSHPDPARRGLSSGGSTGLGLDIAYRIAELSGGTLTLGRSPAGGAAVTMGLGPAAGPHKQPRRHIGARPRLPGRRARQERDAALDAELSSWSVISGRNPGAR